MIPLIFTVLSCNSAVWDVCRSPSFIYKDLIQQQGAKKYILCGIDWLR